MKVNAASRPFIASAVERTRGNVRWIIATRSVADLPIASWLAQGDLDLPIDEETLRFTTSEGARVAEVLAPHLTTMEIAQLLNVTDGAPAIFAFGARTIAQEPAIAPRLLTCGGDRFERFADEVLARCTADERRTLIEMAAYPQYDGALATAAATTDFHNAIASRAPQIFDQRDGTPRFHGLFLRTLQSRLSDLGSEAARQAKARAALALERAGRIGDALAIVIRERNDAELVRMIETHGFACNEAGRGESIQEAINALDPLVQMTSAVVLAIKAMSDSRSGRFDMAESLFQLALERAGGAVRPQIAYQYGLHLVRFFRREAVDIFEELTADTSLETKVRAYASGALGPAYVFERRLDDARRATERALELASGVGSPHLTAKAHHQASYVALYEGDAERAKRLASISLELATTHGYFDIASNALSVLYNVVCDIEDDPNESVRLLDAAGDCAAKSGSLVAQLSALVATLEIEVERNNEAAAERIDEKLGALDVSLSGRATYEALLPTQALRASWSGDFLGAYRLLTGSAESQWSPDRKALRHAEIAFYAAAAGLERDATEAIGKALEMIAKIAVVDLRVQRARCFTAMAAIVLGQSELATDIFAAIDANSAALSPRLLALRRAIGALAERFGGARNHNELLGFLRELGVCGLAGVARTISVLPLTDNAARRIGRLSVGERRMALRVASGDLPASDERLSVIARKLGCVKSDGVVRAAIWHRRKFEGVAIAAYIEGVA